MGNDMTPVVIFEGIATLDFKGVAHDAYLKIRTESPMDGLVRWFGEFEWMGAKPENFVGGEFLDVVLSDGRECVIYVGRFQEDGGSYLFRGKGLPPGFEIFVPHMATAELTSTTLPRWRLVSGRLVGLLAFLLMFSAIWAEDYQWKFLASGLIVSFMSIQLITPGKGRQLPEAKSDD